MKIAAFSECLAQWPRKKTALPHVYSCACVSLVCIYPRALWFPMKSLYRKPHGKIKQILAIKTFVSLKPENKPPNPQLQQIRGKLWAPDVR